MEKLLDIAFAPANFVLTLLAMLVVLYWIVIIFTGLNIDLDAPDAEVEGDLSKADVGQVSGQGFWASIIDFFYIGELPIMFVISIVIVLMWFINVNVTALLGISGNFLGFLVYFPGFIASMLLTKIIAKPFIKLYAIFNHKGEVPIDFIGKIGRVVTPLGTSRMGQIEIQLEEDILKVYAMSIDEEIIPYNETVIILEESKDKKYFLAQKYNY